jgi:hypothetical protein
VKDREYGDVSHIYIQFLTVHKVLLCVYDSQGQYFPPDISAPYMH